MRFLKEKMMIGTKFRASRKRIGKWAKNAASVAAKNVASIATKNAAKNVAAIVVGLLLGAGSCAGSRAVDVAGRRDVAVNCDIAVNCDAEESGDAEKKRQFALGFFRRYEVVDGMVRLGSGTVGRFAVRCWVPNMFESLQSDAVFEESRKDCIALAFEHGSKLKKIEENTFYRSNLTSVFIPASVQFIGKSCFCWCVHLCFVVFERAYLATNTTLPTLHAPQCSETTDGPKRGLHVSGPNASQPGAEAEIPVDPAAVSSVDDTLVDDTFVAEIPVDHDTSSVDDASVVADEPSLMIDECAFHSCGVQSIRLPNNIWLASGAFNYTGFMDLLVPCYVWCPIERWLGEVPLPFGKTLEELLGKPSKFGYRGLPSSCCSDNILEEILFASGCEIQVLGEQAFRNSYVVKIKIPDSVIVIGGFCFFRCRSLRRVVFGEESKLRVIGEHAFSGGSLKKIKIPNNVLLIANNCFANNFGLFSVIFGIDSQLENMSLSALRSCALSNIVIPRSVIEITGNCEPDDRIPSFTFEPNCKLNKISDFGGINIKNMKIPASVTILGKCCFLRNKALTSVIFEKGSRLQKICEGVFAESCLTSI
jgi:hypothetical protein